MTFWFTGSPRFGQCTRYLAGLKAGDKVMVSVKPSVMKVFFYYYSLLGSKID